MKRKFRNRITKLTAIIFLSAFLFSFLHSELGFLNYDGDNHAAHDHCQLVKNGSTTHANNSIINLKIKPTSEKDFSFHCSEKITSQENVNLISANKEFISLKKPSEIYLHNNTFLI